MLDVYIAKTIVTLNRSQPEATAIAVRDGMIVEVGSLSSLEPWLLREPHVIHREFESDVMVPGFIDPHLHPAMAAVILPMHFITAMPWSLPWREVPATVTPEAFDREMVRILAEVDDEITIFWGHHDLWHGAMHRSRIDQLSEDRPVVVWNRSFHELHMNHACMLHLGIDEVSTQRRKQVDLDAGRFYENGLGFAISRLNPFILEDTRFRQGLERLRDVVHFGGHTTIGDMAVGLFDFERELRESRAIFGGPETFFRVEQVPHGGVLTHGKSAQEALAQLSVLATESGPKLTFRKRIKFFADGAFFSQLAQLLPPGYLDGHEGEWLMVPELLEARLRDFWHAGYRIHVHVTGDRAVELTLSILEQLQNEMPRTNHGFVLEHMGYSTPEQLAWAKRLGVSVSANIYYLHELSSRYAEMSVGYERASSMGRLGTCFDEGLITALHSDITMAPAQPLLNMWVAVNRVNAQGDVMAEAERLTPAEALAAVTINAAKILGIEHETGSLRAGKRADVTILSDNPLSVDPMAIKDILVRGTLFEGALRPNERLHDIG